MKENKFIILGVFIALTALYYISYSTALNPNEVSDVTLEDKTLFFNDLDDEQREGIATTRQDSLQRSYFQDSLTYIKIIQLNPEKYTKLQLVSQKTLELGKTIHIFRRLFLIVFLFASTYISFVKKYKYNITFQKALYDNSIRALIFALFSVFAFVITQTIRGTIGDTSILLQYGFGNLIETLKSALIWILLISFFIYFHPQNIDWYKRRMEKKQKKAAKNK